MALTEIPSELSSTPSIVDNGNATAITIDSSENATFAGSVGIGGSSLSLTGNATPGLTVSSNGPFILLQDANNADKVRYISNNTGELQFGIVGDDGATGKTEHMRIDASGNLLVGQSSTTIPGVGNTTAGVSIRGDDGSFFSRALGSSDTNNVVSVNRSTADGNILGFQKDGTTVGSIGTLSGTMYIGNGDCNLLLTGATDQILPVGTNGATKSGQIDLGSAGNRFKDLYLSGNASMAGLSPGIVTISSGSYFIGNTSAGYRFNNAADTTNLMILKDDGNLLVGKTVAINSCHTFYKNQANNTAVFENANSVTPFGVQVRFTGADPNNTSAYMFSGYGHNGSSLTTRFAVMSNGGIRNYQTNNIDISDERVKTDIQPLGSMWDKLKAIEIVGFKYTDQTHERSNIGVIAQQVQSVAPEFVDDSSWDDERFDEPLKSVFSNDLHNATIKALQEAMDRIETLEAKVQTLENN